MTFDTAEDGLERLICTVLTGAHCESDTVKAGEEAQPNGASPDEDAPGLEENA